MSSVTDRVSSPGGVRNAWVGVQGPGSLDLRSETDMPACMGNHREAKGLMQAMS